MRTSIEHSQMACAISWQSLEPNPECNGPVKAMVETKGMHRGRKIPERAKAFVLQLRLQLSFHFWHNLQPSLLIPLAKLKLHFWRSGSKSCYIGAYETYRLMCHIIADRKKRSLITWVEWMKEDIFACHLLM